LRDIGSFDVATARKLADPAVAQAVVLADEPSLVNVSPPQLVIWAGDDDTAAPPRLSIEFYADNGRKSVGGYERWRFVADARTGELVLKQDQILHVDVSGTVSGMATSGFAADSCAAEVATPLPYAYVEINGGASTFANSAGAFTIPNGGAGAVTVNSPLRGQYFLMNDVSGPVSSLSTGVTPPGPANFLHNAPNTSALLRAQVNTYVAANTVRDKTLASNPAYPVISTQTDFDIFVNIPDVCNAYYDGVSINFFTAGGGCANTGYSSVAYHEYGHHMVQVAGSGQGQYGEGMGDCVSVLITDDSRLGVGFQNNCAAGIRNANNAYQYPCAGEIHDCGQLISGCVWSLRNQLLATNPGTYNFILSNLTINSILLHTGSKITPQIGIDFLTLDDNDANLSNQTPHYAEIYNAFNAHNMIDWVGFEYPNGRPLTVTPNQTTNLRVDVTSGFGVSANNGARLNYRIGNAGAFTMQNMNQLAPGEFEGTLPATACPNTIQYYVTADYTAPLAPNGSEVDPRLAPARRYETVAAASASDFVSYNFEVNPGWTVSSTATDGQWDAAPGIPIACGRADPDSDYDGSGRCFLTDNSAAAQCNSDVDNGATTLTSQVFNISALTNPYVQYARYYSNTDGAEPQADTFLVDVSSNGGTTWVNLETVGPGFASANPEVDGEWILRTFRIADFVPVTSQFRIRFVAQDTAGGSLVEAGVDAFKIYSFACPTIPVCGTCPGDLTADGRVDGADVSPYVAAYIGGSLVTGCEDMDSDTDLDASDLTLFRQKLLNVAPFNDANPACP